MMRVGLIALLIACLPLAVFAGESLDGWLLVQLSADDRLAVLQSPKGELLLVRKGDRFGETMRVAGFDGGRLVVERPGEWGRARLFVSIIDGRQVVERLERQPLRRSTVAGAPAAITTVSRDQQAETGGMIR